MKWPFVILGKPFVTLCEQKRIAWSGLLPAYRVTCPVDTRKQWRPITKFKRKAS